MTKTVRLFEPRIPLETARGVTVYVEPSAVYYCQSDKHDTLVRTRRKRSYRSVEKIGEIEDRLPSPPFFRCHRSYIVNLERVRELRRRGERDHDLKLDPPVIKLVPLSRTKLKAFLRAMEG